MAYEYQGAIARKKEIDALWSEVDLANVDLNVIYATYRQVIVTLSHVTLSHNIYLDLNEVRNSIGSYIGVKTLAGWLLANGNNSLPTVNVQPQFRTKPALYGDVWNAGYTVERVDHTRNPDAQIPEGEKNDLLISREDIDFRIYWRYCLISVNGYFHRSGGAAEGLYVVEGGRSGTLANDNVLGMYSFREVASMRMYPITPDMVYKTNSAQKYCEVAHVKLPVSTAGKTVLLVLGGYLHAYDGAYVVHSEKGITIDMSKYQLPERVFQSWGRINLDPLDLTVSANNPRQLIVDELMSDQRVMAYLTLPQSFVIVLDTDSLYVRRHRVERSDLQGRFLAPMPLQRFPLIGSLGRNYDYRAFPQDGRCLLATEPCLDEAYNLSTHAWRDELTIDPTRESAKPWSLAPAHLLEVGRFG